MEQRNNLVLQGTETFSRGQLDNVALDNGSVVLDSVAGRYLQYGSYTTPDVRPLPARSLQPYERYQLERTPPAAPTETNRT